MGSDTLQKPPAPFSG